MEISSLVRITVTSQLDAQLPPIQSLLSPAARRILLKHKSEPVTSLLIVFQWLPTSLRGRVSLSSGLQGPTGPATVPLPTLTSPALALFTQPQSHHLCLQPSCPGHSYARSHPQLQVFALMPSSPGCFLWPPFQITAPVPGMFYPPSLLHFSPFQRAPSTHYILHLVACFVSLPPRI